MLEHLYTSHLKQFLEADSKAQLDAYLSIRENEFGSISDHIRKHPKYSSTFAIFEHRQAQWKAFQAYLKASVETYLKTRSRTFESKRIFRQIQADLNILRLTESQLRMRKNLVRVALTRAVSPQIVPNENYENTCICTPDQRFQNRTPNVSGLEYVQLCLNMSEYA